MPLLRRKKQDDESAEPKQPGRIAQIKQTYSITRKQDPAIPWILLGCFLVPFLILLGVGLAIGQPILFGSLGFMTGLVLATWIFGRRAERAVYAQIEGQPGGAAAALTCCDADGQSRQPWVSPRTRPAAPRGRSFGSRPGR